MVTPAEYNLTIRIGTDFNQLFEFQQPDEIAMDLTGFTIKSQIRRKKRRDADLIAEFVVTIPDPTDGKVYLSLTDTVTSELSSREAYYDVLITSPTEVDELYLEGRASISYIVTEKG